MEASGQLLRGSLFLGWGRSFSWSHAEREEEEEGEKM